MRSALSVAVVLVLAGCSSLDPGHKAIPEVAVTVAEVQRAIACEFSYALENTSGEGHRAISNWGAVVELVLVVKDSANIVPGIGQFSAKVGNATLSTGATLPSATLDGNVEDKNTISYYVGIKDNAEATTCPPKDSDFAASGLELADFLEGAALVISSGGRIASSSSIITTAGVSPSTNAIISSGTIFPAAAAVRELIPTIKYERGFTVSRKVGGGLTFKVNDITLTMTATATGRERKANTIAVTMGARSVEIRSSDEADLEGRVAEPGRVSLEDSILIHRQDEIEAIRGLTPNEVIVVTPPAGP